MTRSSISASRDAGVFRDFVCDLDGTVWLSGAAIPGVAEAIATARSVGHRFLFATNNSTATIAEIEAELAAIGISASGAVVSSAGATATLVAAGERVFVIGGPGLHDAISRSGALVVADPPFDAVAVGRDTSLTFADLVTANSAIRAGARFLASNTDPTFPTPSGPEPGGGVIVAAVALASGVAPQVAGKPFLPMAVAIKTALGSDVSRAIVVGDVAATDGLLADRLGAPFALVLSGTTKTAAGIDPPPAFVVPDLAALLSQFV